MAGGIAVRGHVGAQFVSHIGSWMQTVAMRWPTPRLQVITTYLEQRLT
jgi:hypothetical protein